ncbi:MAG: hypothetical protein K2L37_03300, partial [Lactobacillus sp.]|nr:hypothetical protein [Lactobacillus sp.]
MRNRDLYNYDITTVKQYGEHTVKVTYVTASRAADIEDDRTKSRKGTVNEDKLSNNIARARSKVKELVLCNPWDYWCTFTLDKSKYDRYNLKGYVKGLGEFLHSYNRRCEPEDKVRYLLIPEMHKDGAWHMHGFIKGIKAVDLYKNKNGFLSWRQYEERFGFISMKRIAGEDAMEKLSSYMCKYMTKDISNTVKELGAHSYYSSQGLQKAQTLYKGHAA